MWQFLVRNKQAVAMVGLLAVAAVVVIVLTAKGSTYTVEAPVMQETEDISSDPHIFTCDTLPSDDRFMPSIGNGHIATNIFSDTVYMNGVYNGRGGESHRARIPGWANIKLLSTPANFANYSLDTKEGAFKVRVDRERTVITQRIYAHRFYTRAIVNQIEVTPKHRIEPNFAHHEIWIAIKLMAGPDSKDISFQTPVPEVIENRLVWSTCGQTRVLEDAVYQQNPVDVCAYWTSVPDHCVVPQHEARTYTFAMTVDHNRTVAKYEMMRVLQEDGDSLYRKHVEHWQALHEEAGMDIEGELRLSKIVNGVWYYYLSSLPSVDSHQPLGMFYGLSPTGLARGGSFDDYEGHSIWDTEIWMFPSILLLYPHYAQKLLQYRIEMAYVAAYLARISGYKGYRFPWESAYTGVEVTQPCCPEVAEFEHHISACISFAARQYLSTTRDEDWLKNGGCSLVSNIADFWASRAIMNYTTGLNDISNVMGPDEDHSNITNSVFTNVVAGYSLYLAQYVACLCKDYYMLKDPDRWADIAWSLALPYDEDLDYHPQFTGYKREEKIKQADAVLLGYPLQYPMDRSTRANDLSYYESVTRQSGPAMTWSMHTIGHLQLKDNLTAAQMFNRSYKEYVREPFKIWSELRRPNVGAVNFLTGMGGFLQALIFGYAGVSIHLDRLEFNMPQLPPEATEFTVRGIKYLGANITLHIQLDKTTLTVTSMAEDQWPLVYESRRATVNLYPGTTVTLLGEGPYVVRAARRWKSCKLPADIIGKNTLRPGGNLDD